MILGCPKRKSVVNDVDYYLMLANKIESRKLTTWKTKRCLSFFPYGSSPWPPIASFFLTQIPSLTLTIVIGTTGYMGLAILLAILQFVILVAMIMILRTNPGILPQLVSRCEVDTDLFVIPSRPPSQEHKYLIPQRNLLHQQKYCSQCHIYRPIRAIHCSACNHCVERYDHHCPWLSICIGKYNYKYFLVYLSSLNILILFIICIGLYFTSTIARRKDSLVGDFIVYLVITILAIIFIFPLGRLLIYHIGIMFKGITTNQEIKKTYKIIDNQLPYENVECGIYREKRLPKYSYRKPRNVKLQTITVSRNDSIKKSSAQKKQINQFNQQQKWQKSSMNESNNFSSPSSSPVSRRAKKNFGNDQNIDNLILTDRVSILNSLIKNQQL